MFKVRKPRTVNLFILLLRNALALSLLNLIAITGRTLILSKHFSPSEFAANAISTLLIAAFGFFDIGMMNSLQREIPKNSSDTQMLKRIVSQARRTSYRTYLFSTAVVIFCSVIFLRNGEHVWVVGIIAAGLIYPFQNMLLLNTTLLTVQGNQDSALKLVLATSSLNLVLSLVFTQLVGIWIILVAPLVSILIVQLYVNKSPHYFVSYNAKLKSNQNSTGFRFVDRKSTWITSLLAFITLNLESFLVILLLDAESVGMFGLLMNVMTVIAALPVLLGARVVSRVHSEAVSGVLYTKDSILRKTWHFIGATNYVITLVSLTAFSILATFYLPLYLPVVSSLWVMGTATYLFTNTFYSSSFPMYVRKQRPIYVTLFILIALETVVVFTLARYIELSLLSISIVCLLKCIVYSVFHRIYISKLIGNRDVLSRYGLTNLLQIFTLIGGVLCYLYFGLGVCVVYSLLLISLVVCLKHRFLNEYKSEMFTT